MFVLLALVYIIDNDAYLGECILTKKRLFELIQIGDNNDFISYLFDFIILSTIILNVMISIFLTFDVSSSYTEPLYILELITVILFTVEYSIRVGTSTFLYPNESKFMAAVRYMFSFSGIVDFLSFFPFYLPLFFPSAAVAFRVFRVVRIFRIFHVNPYSDSLTIISRVVKKKRTQLISSVFIIFILMTASSLLMYNIEHPVQPDVFENAFSGFWWAGSTLLTIGYGDIYPITYLGKALGIVISFLGVGLVAIPTGILSAGFVEQSSKLKVKKDPKYCHNCGEKL